MAKAKYSEEEKILCFHGPLLYEAKCLRVDFKDGQMKYFVHYQGWNKNWDEWVTEARMMKFNAVGLQKQKELKEAFSKPGGKKLRKAELQRQCYPMPESLRHLEERMPAASLTASASVSASTSAASAASELEPSAATAATDSLAIAAQPPVLHQIAERPPAATPPSATPPLPSFSQRLRHNRPPPATLLLNPVCDRRLCRCFGPDLVLNQCKLLRLPVGPRATVLAIAGDYADFDPAAEQAGANDLATSRTTRREFSDGLVGLFNACLGCRLLYKFERPQYAALIRSQRSALPAGVYGAAHLLRLMACLPELLPLAALPAGPAGRLLDECQRFVAFLDERFDSYLSVDSYEVAPPDYQRLALCI
uniref:MRG domain-containing protein n=1 Tax=Macrostomum lignano TaxID=282301 RepID=A0A1I8GFT9_9PLAT